VTQDDVIYCARHTAAHSTHAELTESYVGAEILLHHAREERDRYQALYERARTAVLDLTSELSAAKMDPSTATKEA
jgi:hypothetical protein